MDVAQSFAATFVDELAVQGVEYACVSPGSRSAPIAMALQRHPKTNVFVQIDERSGSFQPLAHVPDDRMVVLGLVTTKSGRRETPGELEGRIHDAAAHVDLERLAISPQCGFATSIVGNALTFDDQRAKLETLAQTAERVWA